MQLTNLLVTNESSDKLLVSSLPAEPAVTDPIGSILFGLTIQACRVTRTTRNACIAATNMNNSNNNGNDGAANSSNNLQRGLSSPANDSLQQSYYIAALDRYLEMRGLVSPVIDKQSDYVYTYDFLHVESGTVVKIFKQLDDREMSRYSNRADDRVTCFILDATYFCGDLSDYVVGAAINNVVPEALEAAANLRAYIFFEGVLWELSEQPEGEWEWKQVIPVERNLCMRTLLELPR